MENRTVNAYLILDLAIRDYDQFSEYIEKIPEFIGKHSGRYVVQGVEAEVMEGDWKPERVVVIEFPSKDEANRFLEDPDAQELFKLRHDTTTSKLILVEGCL